MAAEVRHESERQETMLAAATIVAAQLATLVGPPSARSHATKSAARSIVLAPDRALRLRLLQFSLQRHRLLVAHDPTVNSSPASSRCVRRRKSAVLVDG